MPYDSPEKIRLYMRGYRAKRLVEARQILGGVCAVCGSGEDLEFDHIDMSTKVKSVTTMTHASNALFYAEVAKCQLLCRDHHRVKTNKDLGYQAETACGTTTGYRKGCRCAACRAANSANVNRWRSLNGRKKAS